MKTAKIHRSQVPWWMQRNRCARCGGHHAPWWGREVQAPSCLDGSKRVNDMTMFLEYSKALGHG